MADTYNLSVDQGADFFLNVQYKDSADVPINLTGYTAAMQFRQVSTTITALNLTSSSGITITAATGTLAIHITAAQTAALAASLFQYELEITSSAGIITRLLQGVASVNAQLTP
jgi:hypothetical protein